MQVRKVKNSDGSVRYRYRYYEKGKLKSVLNSDLPYHPKTDEQAEVLRKRLESTYEAAKLETKSQEEWHEKYYSYNSLFETFAKYRKKKAKNSYKDKLSYFRNYVLLYFLEIQKLENLETWKERRYDFVLWLRERDKMRGEGKLASQTINHIITEFNVFIDLMAQTGKIEAPFTINLLHKDELNKRGAEAVLSDEESELLLEELAKFDVKSSEIFRVLLNTGMRYNELLSLERSSIKKGEIPEKSLTKALNYGMANKTMYCYIVLSSQIDKSTGKRKPLKSKKQISIADSRFVPIYDKETFNILVRALKESKAKEEETLFHYFYKYSRLNRALKKAYDQIGQYTKKYSYKSSHSARHTYATYLSQIDPSSYLATTILGHNYQTSARYNHTHAILMKKLINEANTVDIDDWEEVA